jgi:hypothetical protein
MKKIFFFLTLITLPYSLKGSDLLFEGRVNYFRPASNLLRQIYGDAWVGGELEANAFLGRCTPCLDRFALFAGVGYTSARGRSIGEGDPTSIWIVPVTLGLKYAHPFTCNASAYLGAGPRYFIAHTEDDSPFVQPTITERGVGGVVEAGFLYRFCGTLTLDLFGAYSFKELCHRAEPPLTGNCVEVGGLSLGAGLGICF